MNSDHQEKKMHFFTKEKLVVHAQESRDLKKNYPIVGYVGIHTRGVCRICTRGDRSDFLLGLLCMT